MHDYHGSGAGRNFFWGGTREKLISLARERIKLWWFSVAGYKIVKSHIINPRCYLIFNIFRS